MAKPRLTVRAANGYDQDAASRAADTVITEPSLTIQSQKEDADINVILRNFGVTGQLPSSRVPPVYADFQGVLDYRDAMELITAANVAFMELPAKVRSRFQNDPAKFVDYCSDPKNLDGMRELGLAVPPEAPAAPNEAPPGAAPPVGAPGV